MNKLLIVPVFALFALSGCRFLSTLDKFYSDKLTPIYYAWISTERHKSISDKEWLAFLEKKTAKTESDMRKDGYNGAQIGAIRNEAYQRADKLNAWISNKGPYPSGERYTSEQFRLIFYEQFSF